MAPNHVGDLPSIEESRWTVSCQCNDMWTKSPVHVSTIFVAKQVHRLLGRDVTMKLVSAFVLNRLDYCNAVLAGLPKSTIAPLQRAQNAAARLLTGIELRDHVTRALQQLHWLPVQYRITFKLCLLMHKIHTKRAPSYLTDKVTATADLHCNPVLVCAPLVAANIRLQGHASNSEREAFPTQDLLHGTVSHNTFEK